MTLPNRLQTTSSSNSHRRVRPHESSTVPTPAPRHLRQPATSSMAVDSAAIEREAHHELLPLIQRLKAMIARPGRLLAAVALDDGDCGGVDMLAAATLSDEHRLLLRKKVAAFQRAELRGLASAWPRFVATASSAGHASAYLARVDRMMMKLALYYMRLWNHVCAVCVDAAFSMRVVALEAQKQWLADLQPEQRGGRGAGLSPMFEAQSLDALSQGIVLAPSGVGANAALAKRSRLTRHSNEFMIGWFIAHKANPYPSADERSQIADKTGLTEQQVRNWFANMRKRHWKPNRMTAKKPRCLLDVVLRKHEV